MLVCAGGSNLKVLCMPAFYCVVLIVMFCFFIQRRKIDFFSLWFAGLVAISPPYIVGYFYIPPLINSPENIGVNAYCVMLLLLFSVMASAIYSDISFRECTAVSCSSVHLSRMGGLSLFLALLSVVGLVFFLVFVGIDRLAGVRSGARLGALESGLLSKIILFAMYSTLLGFASKKSVSFIVGLSVLFVLYFISPSRSFLVMTFLAVMVFYF